jgi:hypothetical protein
VRKLIVPVLTTLIVLAYVAAVAWFRFDRAFEPGFIEGDTKQTIWQFYRYNQPGTLPLGHLTTDYAWVYNAPLLYRAIMIPLSMAIDPIVAGNVLHVVLYLGALAALYWTCRTRAGHYAGLVAVAFFVRTPSWHAGGAGGHARTFGATLTLLFIGAWLSGRRRLCLVILVLQAAVYPPPAMACSIAFGVWTLWAFAKDRRARPLVELAVVGVVVLLLCKSQDLLAPAWWGSPVWYDDVVDNPAFRAGGRMVFVPHDPIGSTCVRAIGSLFLDVGHKLFDGVSVWDRAHHSVLVIAPAAVVLAAALLVPGTRFPRRLLLLLASAFVAYLLARTFAFKLHVPTRVLYHVWPPTLAVVVVVSTFLLAERVLPNRRVLATSLAACIVLAPVLVVHGDALSARPGPYSNVRSEMPVFEWIRNNTRKDAVFAGSYRTMDFVGLLGWRVPYVNWTLAHPFRPGYWSEIERRTLRMYEAYWAADLDTVLRFADEEHVDYFIVDTRHMKSYRETSSNVGPFPPLEAPTRRMWEQCRRTSCVLFEDAVLPAVVRTQGPYRVIHVGKLRTLHTSLRGATTP